MDPIKTEILVVGAGPGGYAAAFYAADLGKKVILVEQDKRLGGVCLNRGCIPSKALLHATEVLAEAKESAAHGITFAAPQLDVARLRAWKESILTKLGQGITGLAQRRGVQVISGRGYFQDSRTLLHDVRSQVDPLDAAGFRTFQPHGAYYVMTDISGFGFDNDVTFARWLVEHIGVAAVPGSSFYSDPAAGRQRLRFHFARLRSTLESAVERLSTLRARLPQGSPGR